MTDRRIIKSLYPLRGDGSFGRRPEKPEELSALIDYCALLE